MAAKEMVYVKVEDYGGSDARKWEVVVGNELHGVRRNSPVWPRFRSERRAYEVAATLATAYVEDGCDVTVTSKSGKERVLHGA